MRILCALSALLLVVSCRTPEDPAEEKKGFSKGFLWGSAVAGFQVDMGCPTLAPEKCEDRHSDWYAWVTTPELVQDPTTHIAGHPISDSPGFWELFEGDFDRAKNELGSNAFRMSIEWSRVFPTSTVGVEGYEALKAVANADAVAQYHRMFQALRARGLTPLVTLHHYLLLSWIHDALGCHKDIATCQRKGWVDREGTVREIAKYAGFVAREFGGEIDLWATLNEPMAVVLSGFIFPSAERTNPPGVTMKVNEARTAMAAMIEAHARMYDAVKANDTADADGDGSAATVGLVHAMNATAPKDPNNRLDRKAAENLFYLFTGAFLNGVARGDMDEDLDGKAEHRADLANRMDYIGINYYTRSTVESTSDGSPALPDLSPLTTFNPLNIGVWETYPRGLYEMAMLVKEQYGKPVYVTENGTQDARDDGTGPAFIVPHVTWLERAARDGADVRGYFYWTLMDNYEWNHGTNWRMGLYAVEPKDPQKVRTARKSVGVYRKLADANGVPAELLEQYPAPE
ncbi:MAG: glycoside hydrolase family 1 protein [Myxococcales bacterium]